MDPDSGSATMKINEAAGSVEFGNLVSATRELGSDEKVTVASPAEKAVACNARGVFKDCELGAIHSAAEAEGAKLAGLFSV